MGVENDTPQQQQFTSEFAAALAAAVQEQVTLAGNFGGAVGGVVHKETGGAGHGDVSPAVTPSEVVPAAVEVEGPPVGPHPDDFVIRRPS